jgi:transcriptional regulator with XRE-family HTH domain
MAKAGKTGVFEKAPNSQSIRFAGTFINLSAISRTQGIDLSYLSRIFSGNRRPSLNMCQQISTCLGMGLEQFVGHLEVRVAQVKVERDKLISAYTGRVMDEDSADLRTYQRGKIPAPRLSALRKIS